MVGGAIRSRLIHRETYRASVLHQLWPSRGEKNTAREFCVLTTPSLLPRGTLRVGLICERAASSFDRRGLKDSGFVIPGHPPVNEKEELQAKRRLNGKSKQGPAPMGIGAVL